VLLRFGLARILVGGDALVRVVEDAPDHALPHDLGRPRARLLGRRRRFRLGFLLFLGLLLFVLLAYAFLVGLFILRFFLFPLLLVAFFLLVFVRFLFLVWFLVLFATFRGVEI